MGLFGFGKKKKDKHEDQVEDAIASETEDEAAAVGEELDADADTEGADGTAAYERGVELGPWDIDEDDAPDYDEYLSLGAFYLPFVQGIQLRIKASRADNSLLGATVTIGHSSLELEAFAAPKTMGLWDDIRARMLQKNAAAKEVEGVFGTELEMPVKTADGKTHPTRIVGVDGPRWMLRGIFSGTAAQDSDAEETKVLNDFFSKVVVDRGSEPLAPNDLIPLSQPLTPGERRELAEKQAGDANDALRRPDGPLSSDQQVEQEATLSRGPMFSELR
ncbi:DUF3710 domain-containing protein [Bifidobacterium cuniculi]|uniref:Cytosolic protein n=1 Tax=Bifidobacterium cuniculi TaxID=1688 RepID=A0A087B3L9_9BIFI|nr:DUF3710 domain-containing protein [Bifidobacterium cuniculi]KFI65619.1 cytosolic protein [Bifidobacterium cuniculi]